MLLGATGHTAETKKVVGSAGTQKPTADEKAAMDDKGADRR